MRVAIYEDNLLWSTRLQRAVTVLGHEAKIVTDPTVQTDAECAILNLGSARLGAAIVPLLKSSGATIVAHAGHKEKDLHELGRDAGCDILATNSEMAHKLADILARVESRRKLG